MTAQKCWNLKDIDDLSSHGGLLLGVHIGEHRDPDLLPDPGKNFKSSFQARPAKGFCRCAIGFVVAGFENVIGAEFRAELLHGARDLQAKLLALDHAGTGDEREPLRFRERLPERMGSIRHGEVVAAVMVLVKLPLRGSN